MVRKYTWGRDLSGTLSGAGGIGGLLAVYDAGQTDDYVYFYDANGNVGQVVDLSAADPNDATVAKYEYDPYGQEVGLSSLVYKQPFRFSTKYFDTEVGLGYWGQRYYWPKLGRWINRDPIGELGGRNLYRYVLNNPMSRTDSVGLYVEKDVLRNPDGTVTWHIYDRGLTGWFKNEYLGSITFDPDDDNAAVQAQYYYERFYELSGTVPDVGAGLEITIYAAMIGLPGPEDLLFPTIKLLTEATGLVIRGGKVFRAGKALTEAEVKLLVKEAAAVRRAAAHAMAKHVDDFPPGTTIDEVIARIMETINNAKGLAEHPWDGRKMFWYDGWVVIIDPASGTGGTVFKPKGKWSMSSWVEKVMKEWFGCKR